MKLTMGRTTRIVGRKSQRHDCGEHGELTVAQIAGRVGTSHSAIYRRIRAGTKGAALVAPRHDKLRHFRTPATRPVVLTAVKLVTRFPDRLPSVEEIIGVQPMSHAGALRWRKALAKARDLKDAA